MNEVNKLVDELVLRGHQLSPEEKEEKFKRLKRLLNGENNREYQIEFNILGFLACTYRHLPIYWQRSESLQERHQIQIISPRLNDLKGLSTPILWYSVALCLCRIPRG